jgi:hypothetical protein
MNLIEEALTGHWGPKCSEYEEGCIVCDAWREYENLATYGETLTKEAQKSFTDVNKDGKFVPPRSLSIAEESIRNRVGKLMEEKDICTLYGKNLNAS